MNWLTVPRPWSPFDAVCPRHRQPWNAAEDADLLRRTRWPTELAAAHKRGVDIVGPDNERWIRHVLTNCQKVVVAWGAQGPRRERIGRLVTLADEMKVTLHAIGVNQDGNPRHPLTTAYATPMTEWRHAV